MDESVQEYHPDIAIENYTIQKDYVRLVIIILPRYSVSKVNYYRLKQVVVYFYDSCLEDFFSVKSKSRVVVLNKHEFFHE